MGDKSSETVVKNLTATQYLDKNAFIKDTKKKRHNKQIKYTLGKKIGDKQKFFFLISFWA